MDPLSAIIRKAEPSDINQMTGLLKELFSLEEYFTFNKAAQREGLSMMLDNNEKRCIMAAASEKQIMGMCTAQLLVSTAEGGMAALIEDMIVAKLYREMGIGKKLFLAIEKWRIKMVQKECSFYPTKIILMPLIFIKNKNGKQRN